jgi:hypothetical protein
MLLKPIWFSHLSLKLNLSLLPQFSQDLQPPTTMMTVCMMMNPKTMMRRPSKKPWLFP